MKNLKNQKTLLIILSSLVISVCLFVVVLIGVNQEEVEAIEEEEIKTTTTVNANKKIYVDVKGSVKKPGVYEVNEGSIVNDCIKLAGGVTSSGTVSNINLSKKVTDEMVIYVFKKKEITTTAKNEIPCKTEIIEVNNCPIVPTTRAINDEKTTEQEKPTKQEKTTEIINKIININTASKEELMTLSGIGSSKANSIIEYRKSNPFKSIEEIKNVSGIGDSLYDAIKDSITV